VIHVLGVDWIASTLSDRKLVWLDGVSLTALLVAALLPIGLYRRIVPVIDEACKHFRTQSNQTS
jgi:hypothetical protein